MKLPTLGAFLVLMASDVIGLRTNDHLKQKIMYQRSQFSSAPSSPIDSFIIDTDALLSLRTNKNDAATKYKGVVGTFLDGGYKQLTSKQDYTVTDKTLATPSGSKNDWISLAPYFWHPTEIAESKTIT